MLWRDHLLLKGSKILSSELVTVFVTSVILVSILSRNALLRTCVAAMVRGRNQRICRTSLASKRFASFPNSTLSSATVVAAHHCWSKSVVQIVLNGVSLQAVDTGGSES